MGVLKFRFGGLTPLIAVTAALWLAGMITPALAGAITPGTLCPNLAGQYNPLFGISYSPGPRDGFCGNPPLGSAVTITLTDESQYNALVWTAPPIGSPLPDYPHYFPAGTTLGQLLDTTLSAHVSNAGGYLPYYQLVFQDSNNALPGSTHDLLHFDEVPVSTVAGNYMVFDADTTELTLRDASQPANSPSGEHTLSYWLSQYPGLQSDAFNIYVALGLTGGSGTNASVTVYSLDIGSVSDVPEPATPAIVGLGLIALGFLRKRRAR